MPRRADPRGYRAITDPYCYAGTTVLKNLAGIHDPETLQAFEDDMATQRAEEQLPSGRFSVSHFKAIHRHLFQDVYAWAGMLRTVRISKDNSTFCYPENIPGELKRLFGELRLQDYLKRRSAASFADGAAHFLAELNAIHAFREGNGRTQFTLLVLLAENAEHHLNLSQLEATGFLHAMIRSFDGDERLLETQILTLLD